jgi:hypothetical protein
LNFTKPQRLTFLSDSSIRGTGVPITPAREGIMDKKFFLLTGLTTFDNNHIAHKQFKIFKIINGKLEIF